jgi:hypothetical protein
MEPARLFLIVCATIIIGVGIPAGLYFMLRRENRSGFMQIMQKSAKEIRQPYKIDQDNMDELARRVAELKNSSKDVAGTQKPESPGSKNKSDIHE